MGTCNVEAGFVYNINIYFVARKHKSKKLDFCNHLRKAHAVENMKPWLPTPKQSKGLFQRWILAESVDIIYIVTQPKWLVVHYCQ